MPQLKDKNAGIFKIKINVGAHFDEEPETFFVELREPTTEETFTFMPDGNEDRMDQKKIFEVIPKCIIDHNFYHDEEEKKKMSTKEVWEECYRRMPCAVEIVQIWSENLPLALKKQTQSDG